MSKIKTDAEYDAALFEIWDLWEELFASAAFTRLQEVSEMVEEYESANGLTSPENSRPMPPSRLS